MFRIVLDGPDTKEEEEPDGTAINTHEEIFDDEKRKIRHSDSIYLLRKKVKKTSDLSTMDEDDLSTSSVDEADEGETAVAPPPSPPPAEPAQPSEAN